MSQSKGLKWERRPDDRPLELMQAALRLLGERGYQATRLDEVADAAGVSKATVYYYFENKDALLAQAMLHLIRPKYERLEAELAGMQAPASVKLRHVLRTGWRVNLEFPHGPRILSDLAADAPELFRLLATEGMLRRWRLVRGLIEEGKTAGEFRPDVDAEVAARMISSGLSIEAAQHVQLSQHGLETCDADRLFDSSIELFLHALRPASTAATQHGGEA